MILSFTYKIGWKSSSNLWGCVKWFECYEATQGLNIQLAASHFETKQMATRAVIHTHLYQRDLRISCLPRIIRKRSWKKAGFTNNQSHCSNWKQVFQRILKFLVLLSLVIRLSNRFIKKRRLENEFTCRKKSSNKFCWNRFVIWSRQIIQSSDHDKT